MAKKEWVVMHCLDAFKDAHGNAGQHKVILEGYGHPDDKTGRSRGFKFD